ncbi:MAG: hypothetical protein DRO16_03630 [Thermoprotei archaeon]|nr:MAG: hypothetical protein DRO16_03630 [Thermoprotei archaeon]
MYWKGLFLLLIRLLFLIIIVTLYTQIRENPIIFVYSSIVFVIGSIIIYYSRGGVATYSYTAGFFLIIALFFLTRYIYGGALGIAKYCFLYSAIIPLVISLTIFEIVFLIDIGFMKPILFLLVTLKLNFAYFERFSNVLEVYRIYYRSKYRTYVNSIRSIIGSLPYMVLVLAEYLYANMRKLFE